MNPGDFVLCVRDVEGGKFGSEPGPSTFLVVPPGKNPSPRHAIGKDDWAGRVQRQAKPPAAAGANGDILVFIHGYNNDQAIVMQRHRRLRADLEGLGFAGAIVSFDWPSAASALNYLEDRSDAKATALELVDKGIRLLAARQDLDCRMNVHLLAHSTGAYVIREAFDDADDRRAIAAVNWTVSQIAFIAGDVSSASMSPSDSASESVYRHCVRLTNYWNPYDSVLKLSNMKRLGTAPRVGRVGLPDDAPGKAVDVDCGDYFRTLDESEAVHFGSFTHSWHIGDPVFTQDLLATIRGDIDRDRIPTRRMDERGKLLLVRPR
ncbi:MAG: alpha/beta hydrolase [Acidobacteria bacterium]|nr:alpha/beta hydrolase [Acidobacteriota bacterium]